MSVYNDAMVWANARGDSGGATRMRQALMSLYNWRWSISIGEALANLDPQGQRLLFACLAEYARHGETDELRTVGDAIRNSGQLDGWLELLTAGHEAQALVRARWRSEERADA
jgi:hypothetical protein